MPLECDHLLLCDRVIEDAATSTVSAISLYEQISTTNFPALHPQFGVLCRFTWVGPDRPDRLTLGLRLTRHEEGFAPVVSLEFESEVQLSSDRVRFFHNFPFLRLKQAGLVSFAMDVREDGGPWREAARASLTVAKLEITPEMQAQLDQLQKSDERGQ